MNNEDLELERGKLDAQIQDLEVTIIVLKRQRNALTSISQLSTDVLLSIFEYLQFPPGGETEGVFHPFICRYSNMHSELSWIKAMTHVCAEWRNLALSTRRLWSRIKFRDPLMTMQMLERSRESPIEIIFQLEDIQPFNEQSLQYILAKHFDRVRHLEISATIQMHGLYLQRLLISCPINVLQAFSCSFLSGSPFLPTQMLLNSAQSLRYLYLSRCTFRDQDFIKPIHLPQLALLSLYEDVPTCVSLLKNIKFPATCFVSIWCWDTATPGALAGDYYTFHPFISQYWKRRGSTGKRLDFIRIQPFPEIHIRSSTSMEILLSDTQITQPGSNPDGLLLRYEGPSFPNQSTPTLRGVLGCLPLVQVTTMYIDFDTPLPSFWSKLSESCPNLRYLTIGEADPTAFLRTLVPQSSKSSQIGSLLSALGSGSGGTRDRHGGNSSGKTETSSLVFSELQHLAFFETSFQIEETKDLLFTGLKHRFKKNLPFWSVKFYSVLGLSIDDEFLDSIVGFVREEVYISGTAEGVVFPKHALAFS